MSLPPERAVFLSYASQDAAAVERIAEALRAAGVEVWFDRNELTGGDAWDAKIRKQIKDCALFVPIISANTQARTEGYFRLEWRLADQRTHLMAKGRPFLLPVVIDATRDADAAVPDSFTEVQWTRLPDGETPTAFCVRVQKLLGREVAPASSRPPEDSDKMSVRPRKKTSRAWLVPAVVVLAGIVAVSIWRPWQRATPAPTAPAGGGAVAETSRLRAALRPDEWTRADFDAFTPTIDRLIQANPENGEAWALRSIANSLLVIRNFDTGTKPLETGREAADRAQRLTPNSPLAELSLGLHLVAMISRGSDVRAPRLHIDRGLAGLPTESLTRYAELASFFLGYQFEGTDKSARSWLAADPQASFPAWILAQSYIARRQPTEAAKWAERASADPDITGVRSLVTLFEARYYLQADLAAARVALERVPVGQRGVHRVVASRFVLAMAERHYDQALQELARTPESMLLDRVFHGPKALLAGLAHEAAGRAEVAQAQFRESERVLREELARDPDNQELRAVLALNLACLGRADDARRELAAVEPLLRGQEPSVYSGQVVALIAQTHGALGEFEQMAPWLRRLFTEPSPIPFTPASLRLDPRFSRFVSDPRVQALLAEFSRLDVSASSDIDQKSVAVLAFANLSDDKGNEYFSDGISEELLNVLAKVPGLKVSARTSAFYFKGKQVPIPEIARQLGVAYVVEGSVRKSGPKVRITAQLIRASDGFQVWASDNFDRELKDIFAVQDEIAGLIAQNLQLKLGMKSAARAVNPEAYALFLQGRAILNRGVPDDYAKAIQCFKDSLALDGDSALAWAWLALGYSTAALQDAMPAAPGYALAREAANHALALDPELAEGHTALGSLQFLVDWDWARADASLQHALTLAPGDANTLSQASNLAQALGQTERALQLGRKAVALDPLNYFPALILGKAYFRTGRFAEMQKVAEQMIAVNPAGRYGPVFLTFARLLQGRIAAAAQTVEQMKPEGFQLMCLALVRHAQGRTAESEAALNELKTKYGQGRGYQIAEVYAYRGEVDRAFEWLETSFRERDSGLTWLVGDPFMQSLHRDSRWPAFLKKMNLPDVDGQKK